MIVAKIKLDETHIILSIYKFIEYLFMLPGILIILYKIKNFTKYKLHSIEIIL